MRHLSLLLLLTASTAHGAGPDSLAERLRDADLATRRAAAATARSADREALRDALPAMIDVLQNEKDGQVRLGVFDALTDLGPDAEPAAAALVETFRKTYGGQRTEKSHQDYRAALALAAIGKPAVAGLRGLLAESKEAPRAEAAMALGRIGPDAAPAVPDLIKLLGGDSDRVRREASTALGRIGPDAIGPLIAAAGDGTDALRAAAIEALGGMSPPDGRARDAVLKGATDASPAVRAAAIRAIPGLGLTDEAFKPVALAGLRDDDPSVRVAAVNLLNGRRPLLLTIAPELEALLATGGAREAAFLLRSIGPDAVPRLLAALRQDNPPIELIAEALAEIGRPAHASLAEALKAPEPGVRRGAALALGKSRPLAPDAVGRLAAGLGDPDVEVRVAFLDAIGFLGTRAADSGPAVRDRLTDESSAVRGRAVEVLAIASPRDDRLPRDLTAVLDDPDTTVRRRALAALGALGSRGRGALPKVVTMLQGPDEAVRLAALEWVGGLGPFASEAVTALIGLIDDPSPKVRKSAVLTIGKLGAAAQAALPRLAALLEAGGPADRETVVSALGGLELDATAARPYLARALRDDSPQVRLAALRSVQRLGRESALLLPDLIEAVAVGDDGGAIRGALRRFERRGPDPRSIPELVEQLGHDKEPVRLLSVKFLGLAGKAAADAIPALEKLREDPSDEVRKQAEDACERIKTGADRPTR